MSSSQKIRVAAAGAACLGLGVLWFSRDPGSEVPQSTELPVTAQKSSPTRPETVREERPLTFSVEGGPPLRVAMDEVCVKGADGVETFLKLDPPATVATLRSRMAELSGQGEVLPVVYPEEEERSEKNRGVVTRKLRVQIPDGDAAAVAASNHLEISERPDYALGWTIMSAEDPLAALAAVNGVRGSGAVASADVLVARKQFARTMPNDPLVPNQWHLKNSTTSPSITHANVENAWKYGLAGGVRGAGIRIGIVDDGLETTHPDLAGNVDTANGRDWNGNDLDPNPVFSSDRHGTACAGVAGAIGNNLLGVSGVAPEAKLVGMRLISSAFTDQQVAEAVAWKNDIIQVKSNSWGPYDDGESLEGPGPLTLSAFENATTNGRGGKGTIFVWAGGNGKQLNDNSNYDGYANSIYTIAVGASDSNGTQSYYSEPGANLLVVAPSSGGTGVTTTDRTGSAGYNTSSGAAGNYHDAFGGTSSATPVVSGVVALMLQKNPNLGWRDVQEILIRTATKIRPADPDWVTNGGGFHFNHKFGAGLVNATAAVDMAATWVNLPARIMETGSRTGSTISSNGTSSLTFPFPDTNLRVERATVTFSASHASRGNLSVKLIAPSGTVSQLAESHADTNANYTNWTFSSTRHWGELSTGSWTLEVKNQGSVAGTIGTCTIQLHGTPVTRVNPGPQLQITSPGSGQEFPSGSTVHVTVSASDLTLEGDPGTVSQVELLVNGSPVGTDPAAPYEFSINPADGIHTLLARATDNEGAVGTSPSIQIAVANQPPVISAATLSTSGQAFTDEVVTVASVTASDPEGSPLSYTYQWQSSVDDRIYTNVPGRTTATLPANPANAAKLWRCMITPTDGINTGTPFPSPAVNLLARAPASAKTGSVFQYDSGLVLRGRVEAVNRRAIINEFSQGTLSGGAKEWVELLVLQQGSLVGWKLQEADSNQIILKNHALWSNVPAGTLVLIYNGADRDGLIPPDDFDSTDGRIIVGSNNATYFTTTNWLGFSNSGGDFIALGNGSTVSHKVSYGTNSTGSPWLAIVAQARAAAFTGGSDNLADLPANWLIGDAASATPGVPNTPANQAFVTNLRNNTLVENPPFRLGAGSDVPAGLSLNTSTGRLSGTLASGLPARNHLIVIERTNSLGEVVSQTFTLRVFPANYAAWIGSYPVLRTEAPGDDDADGLPNLVEYMLDLDPNHQEVAAPLLLVNENGAISLTFRQSKLPEDATLVPEWATTLDSAAAWQTSGVTMTILEEDGLSKLVRASLEISPEEGKRFLRLKATLTSP